MIVTKSCNQSCYFLKMIRLLLVITFSLESIFSFAQFPFEKYRSIKSTQTNFEISEQNGVTTQTVIRPKFFKNGDSLSIKLVSFGINIDSSIIELYRNRQLIHSFLEKATFSFSELQLYEADVNGDSLLDLKFYTEIPGNGIAIMDNDVVYLFQNPDERFTKISFVDVFYSNDGTFNYRGERDFDGDNNFEIITMTLIFHGNHSYWKFDLYNFVKGELVNVSSKYRYPILIQYLNKPNFKVTDKVSYEVMKSYLEVLPCNYNKQ